MSDLSVEYLGVHFENPFVLASAPPSANCEMIARAFEAGWAGAVIKTLIGDDEPVANVQNRFASSRLGPRLLAFQNVELVSETPPEKWFDYIRELKKDFPRKVIIGSVMGDAESASSWVDITLGCQEAGADLVELNLSCPHGYPEKAKGSTIGQSAEYSSRIMNWVRQDRRITVPVVPKLTGAVTDISFTGQALADAGADGICAINTYPAFMGFDLKTLTPKLSIGGYTTEGGYSGPGMKPIALRCISDLAHKPGLPIMGSGGIFSGFDAVEFMLLGASLVQVCTAVMFGGYGILTKMSKQVEEFMEWHGFSTVGDFIGRGGKLIRKHSELNREFTVQPLIDEEECIGCRKCMISCRDGGFQAIEMREKLPVVDLDRCRGCSLCYHVCPTDAITMAEGAKSAAR